MYYDILLLLTYRLESIVEIIHNIRISQAKENEQVFQK